MSEHEEAYKAALAGKNIPIVTADDKWRMLFGEEGATPEIDAMARQLDDMIDRQSMYKQKIRDIKRLKKTLLDEVIVLSDKLNSGDKSALKDLDDHKRLVKDCNSEMEQLEESLIGMPTAIYELNFKLMIASMEVCYSKLHSNTERINEIDAWLSTTRKELKKQVIRLQEGEAENFNLYSYMHQIFGPEVLDIFDMAYDPEREHKVRSGDIIE